MYKKNLLLLCFCSHQVLAADCSDASGTNVTISTSCTGGLIFSGDVTNLTINLGIEIETDGKGAVSIGDNTVTTLTNNGTIETTSSHYGLRHTGSGLITTLINNGSITSAARYGLSTGSSATITTIENSGTISAGAHSGLRNYLGTIGTITNSGTISAVGKWGLYNNGTIEKITNSGTISAGNTDNDSDYGFFNSGTIETITNSGTISATNRYGLYNSGTITNLTNTNTGTISAGTNYAIANTGSIGTFTNTGTLTPTGATGISNQGSITTFNNSQGKSGSNPVTFIKSLPTNYNVIVNSTSDYGQIEFSSISGNTSLNFGIHSTSTLAEDTYSSVITGLSSSNISSGTSGTYSNSNACADVNAATATFSSNCAELDISGDSSDITINSGVTISGVGDYDWTLNNSSGTTWDLVSTAQLDDAVNTGTNTSLNNLGTITAVATGANGILNQGTFTTLTNRGVVTSDSAYGINNTGTITTLNNLQGASSSALTYDGKLPTNYNVIVNSTSDFGKTVFSSVSGTTTFGVDSTSTLAGDTTYSSVLSGLSSSNIASGTSGSYVSGSSRKDWTLDNSSGSLWDLIVAADQDITPDTNTSVTTSVKPNVILGINNLTSVTEVNFANMNTYDCDLFDKNNICLSLGGRYTSINTPKTETNSAVLVGGYKLSDTLRVGAFYHSNLSHKTPASFTLSDKTPMTGGLLVWNQNPNHLGYQLKLANAQQQKNATLTREIVGSSEEGKGETVIEAKSYVAELQYGYQYGDNTVLRPYFAARSAVIKQDAYTETGLSSPLTFNEIKDKSTTVLLGLKFNTDLNQKLSLRGSIGIEHDIEHSVDKLAPTGISGLSVVSLTDSFNKTRPVVSLGLDYAFKPNHRLSGTLQYQELPYESKTESNAYLYYTIGF